MLVAKGRSSPGEDIWLGDCCLCKNGYHLHYSDCANL